MADIISLHGKTRPETIKSGIIETLEAWLEVAHAGKVRALLVCGVNEDNTACLSAPGTDENLRLLGVIEYAKRELLDSFDE